MSNSRSNSRSFATEQSASRARRPPRTSHPDRAWLIGALFGERHWCRKWVDSLCRADPEFFPHLAEQGPGYPHFLCLLHLASDQKGRAPLAREPHADQAERIRTTGRQRLLEELYGDCPEGLLTILRKLGPKPLSRGDYRAVMSLRSDPKALARLTHRPAIRRLELDAIAELPAALRTLPVTASIANHKQARAFRYFMDIARTLRCDLGDTGLARALRNTRDLNGFLRWLRRQLDRLAFAPPPWDGTAGIHPVRNVAELRAAARRFQNCSMHYLHEALGGDVYFYIAERAPALIMLRKDPLLGWEIAEYRGIKNRKVPASAARRIRRVFADAGIHPSTGWEHGLRMLLGNDADVDVNAWLELPGYLRP